MTTVRKTEVEPLEQLHRTLVESNLTSLSRGLSALLDQAQKDQPGFSEFLRRALEVEQAARYSEIRIPQAPPDREPIATRYPVESPRSRFGPANP